MKADETAKLYKRAVLLWEKRAADIKDGKNAFYQENCNRRHRILKTYDARDIEAALQAWERGTTPTASSRPRGAFMPDPADL